MTRAFLFPPAKGRRPSAWAATWRTPIRKRRAVFDAVDEALGEKLSALIWEGRTGQADADTQRAGRR